jgi:hypothetical protein
MKPALFFLLMCLFWLNCAIAQSIPNDALDIFSIPKSNFNLSQVKIANTEKTNATLTGCDTMYASLAGGNQQNGNLFDVVNSYSLPIQITNFDQCYQSTMADTLMVFYKNGTFLGFEANPGAWTLAGKAYVTPTVANTPLPNTLTLSISIPSGQTCGFYITTQTAYLSYSNGATIGALAAYKNGLTINQGKGIAYLFGQTYPSNGVGSRIWNGIMHYCIQTPTDIENPNQILMNIQIYPNPAKDELHIQISPEANLKEVTLNMYDLSGRLVFLQDNLPSYEFKINPGLMSGLYVLSLFNKDRTILNKKIAIQ